MDTALMLMARYKSMPVIPLATAARDIFAMEQKTLVKKIEDREIVIPLIRMERTGQRAARGFHVSDLAAYIDERRAVALREMG